MMNWKFLAAAISAVLAIATPTAPAAVFAYWSFQTEDPETFTTVVTNETFPGLPLLTRTGSTDNNAGTGFSNPEDGVNYSAGRAMFWTSVASTFTLSLDTTGLTDLNIRMDIRSAESGAGTRTEGFTSVEYSLNGGTDYTLIAGIPPFGITSNNFNAYSIDLSALDAIENQANVLLQFSLPEQNNPNFSNVRIDNLLVTAVPEPASMVLVALAGGTLLFRRRR